MSRVPLSMFGGSSTRIQAMGGDSRERGLLAQDTAVTPGLFETLDIPLLGGRLFRPTDDAAAPPVAVLGGGLARALFAESNPIGQRLRRGEEGAWREVEVVGGVAGTRSTWGTQAEDSLQIYLPLEQSPRSGVALVARGRGEVGSLPETLKGVVQAVAPEAPILQSSTLDQSLSLILYPARFASHPADRGWRARVDPGQLRALWGRRLHGCASSARVGDPVGTRSEPAPTGAAGSARGRDPVFDRGSPGSGCFAGDHPGPAFGALRRPVDAAAVDPRDGGSAAGGHPARLLDPRTPGRCHRSRERTALE